MLNYSDKGQELINAGKVGCIILAGGDGSRLGWPGPKGTFRLPHINKTLFEILLEKITSPLPLAVMTSPSNHAATKATLLHWVTTFTQHTSPLLDLNKKPLPIAKPNGNGEVFAAFAESGLWQKWKAQGITWIQVIPVDNPLALPFDPEQIGIHAATHADMTLRAVKRLSVHEKVGLVGVKEGKIAVVEYDENPPPAWDLANTGLFSFHKDFIEKIKEVTLPIHLVKRSHEDHKVFKQETFIFDLLPYSNKTEVIPSSREATFAPLKSLEDVEKVEKAIRHQYV